MSKKEIPVEKWKWRGIPGHLCVANRCCFHMVTDIGKYKISTVGAYYPNENDKDMKEIGVDRHYETFVFPIDKDGDITDLGELDTLSVKRNPGQDPYETDLQAEANHMKMCKKWAKQ